MPLLQEIYIEDPWKMLVACILLNQTSYKQVHLIRDELFETYPDPESMSVADERELAELLRPLGLYNRRAVTLKKFSEQYLEGFTDVGDLYGIGRYAVDSWKIFQDGDLSVRPTDSVLKRYLSGEFGPVGNKKSLKK